MMLHVLKAEFRWSKCLEQRKTTLADGILLFNSFSKILSKFGYS